MCVKGDFELVQFDNLSPKEFLL